MLMQNPTRNFSGGMRNLGHTNRIQNNNNMGDRDISNTIAADEIREATSHATLGKCPKSLYDLENEWEHGLARGVFWVELVGDHALSASN